MIRRPESLWKMSYGYFWRTKCLVSPQGKPWIARVGITWKERPGWCAWHLSLKECLFCSHCHRSPSEETVQKAPSICESFCEKLTDVLCGGGKRNQKMNSAISHLNLLVTFQETWLVTPPLCSFHLPKCPRLEWLLEEKKKKRVAAMANSCCGLGVHKVWRMESNAHVDVPLLHLTETISL